MIKKSILYSFCLCLLCVFTYFHPTKEYMVCNDQYECKITHKYFGFIQFHDKLNLNSKSFLWQKVIPVGGYNSIWYHSYLEYDNISPFVYYWNCQSYQKDINYVFNIEQKRFNEYLLNPQTKYEVGSEANIWHNLIYIIIFIPLMLRLFLDEYFERKKNKRKISQPE